MTHIEAYLSQKYPISENNADEISLVVGLLADYRERGFIEWFRSLPQDEEDSDSDSDDSDDGEGESDSEKTEDEVKGMHDILDEGSDTQYNYIFEDEDSPQGKENIKKTGDTQIELDLKSSDVEIGTSQDTEDKIDL